MRRLLPLAPLAVASLILTSTSPARASGDDAAVLVAAVALFDVVSLPADLVMAVAGTRVSREYAQIEAWMGGIQAVGGTIGLGFCSASESCRSGAALPVLAGFTLWTTIMTIHGAVSYQPRKHSTAVLPARGAVKVAPLVGDGRKTPAGIGLVGTF